MKKFFKKFAEVLILIALSAVFAVYITICAEHGFQEYPYYGIIFGVVSFVVMSTAMLGFNALVDQLQKERKKNK